ncbi:choline transporter-like 2 isoform X1 [Neodiprion fabricii]|uniref:choline transporter-like 2 isoform X1 n=1 Tax=Neodiprion fabricii TaxID=2872261 RepID=UPI001ED8F6C4|nr:choline transporter-like 2 isoform X1 [Neodiprion fabricii]
MRVLCELPKKDYAKPNDPQLFSNFSTSNFCDSFEHYACNSKTSLISIVKCKQYRLYRYFPIPGDRMQFDPKYRGPLKGRSCTDCFCLIIFSAFVVGWAVIGYYAYTYGDIDTLVYPTDSEGRICGRHTDVEDRPYLVFFDLTKCVAVTSVTQGCDTPQVCVPKCPTDNFVWQLNSSILANNLTALRTAMICKIEIDVDTATADQLATYVSNDVCAQWYLTSTSVTGRCIPNGIPELFVNYTMTVADLEEASTYIELLVQVEIIVLNIYDDIIATGWTIASILGISAAISLIYIILLRWLATPVIFLSIIGLCLLLGYSTYQFYELYTAEESTFWLVLTIICGIILAIVLLIAICLRNRIRLACKLIGEASKAVSSTTSTLIFPVVPWVVEILLVVYAILAAIYLVSIKVQTYSVKLGGNCSCPEDLGYTNGTTCDQTKFNSSCTENGDYCISGGCYLNTTSRPWFSNYLHAYNVVAVLWLVFFATAFGEMALAGTFATWYWTFKKSKVPFFTLTSSCWRTVRYHLGTLAVGSLIITICRLIRWVLEWIDVKLKQYDNEVVRFLVKCMKCCFWLLEKFLKFINRNAYIMCAVHGKGFCASAKSAFNLLMRNILRVFVLDKITDLLLLIGKVLVTGGMAWGTWWYTKNYLVVTYWYVPVVLVGVGTYLVASVFFSVYSTAVDTLFLCFLEDCERNDGTPEKPYYMNKGLLKILRK